MKNKISSKQFTRNVGISILVQIFSLIVSFILNLVVPKYIDELQYAHWQTYLLYATYVGILHFGLLDGIVLRYSQYDYDELDKSRVRSQFQLLLLLNSLSTLVMIMVSIICFRAETKTVFSLVAIGIITKNVYTYTSYTFQITNRISKYALLVISMRLFYGAFTVILLLFKVNNFYWYCIADLASDLFGVVVGYFYNKGLYFGKSLPIKDAIQEFCLNISSGAMLMLANWSANLLIGGAKMFVQWHWDKLVFGRVSFSFSVSNIFLTFVTAISVVLFPSLKRLEQDKLPRIYQKIRNSITPVLFLALLFYFPGCWVLNKWIPKYNESLAFLGILLPIIIYTSKVSLLTNNYLKAYRKERDMFIINLSSLLGALFAYGITSYIMNSLFALLTATVIVLMARSIISEIVVTKIIGVNLIKDFVLEGVMTVLFILSARYFDLLTGFFMYGFIYLCYLFINRRKIKETLKFFAKRRLKS